MYICIPIGKLCGYIYLRICMYYIHLCPKKTAPAEMIFISKTQGFGPKSGCS